MTTYPQTETYLGAGLVILHQQEQHDHNKKKVHQTMHVSKSVKNNYLVPFCKFDHKEMKGSRIVIDLFKMENINQKSTQKAQDIVMKSYSGSHSLGLCSQCFLNVFSNRCEGRQATVDLHRAGMGYQTISKKLLEKTVGGKFVNGGTTN